MIQTLPRRISSGSSGQEAGDWFPRFPPVPESRLLLKLRLCRGACPGIRLMIRWEAAEELLPRVWYPARTPAPRMLKKSYLKIII